MERTAVQSQDIAIVGYDKAAQTLEVAFRTGRVYHFSEVPEPVYHSFIDSPSLGIYFRDHIRDKYKTERIA